MKLYRTTQGILLEHQGAFRILQTEWDALIRSANLPATLEGLWSHSPLVEDPAPYLHAMLPPVGQQELWASGVTYLRSKSARMEESREAGGGNFYDKVYEAPRPELFFKAMPHRIAGHRQPIRIRRDALWNVPEPELTLVINPSGRICAYTIGNDVSSRDIEGENPLYLPQAKSYEGSAAIGPCLWVPDGPIPPETEIHLQILRGGVVEFEDTVALARMKRSLEELVSYLYRELDFPNGSLLMTGTGIVPPNDFTLQVGDQVRIRIDPVGVLENTVTR
ncbi:fumarylacetoacetate hydrolase family protein [Robiginitalea sp. M366]|uniref:fumarylacetoacetate hydrolase family protein n=1 Tax=Robiginitalea aestuariiviva TaxID=3036903 RepID=UPI00240E8ED0|nr:fumarylacetoacetate hydrolase family protein [Robiginitalea aestuariiviva]MDG1571081.1 fumarylacetoacetate hydrolase family protein [Robiginitalea aestuariiviva]